MANIFVDCPHCNQKIGTDQSSLGKEILCPVCHKFFIVNNTKKNNTSIVTPKDTLLQQAIKSFTADNAKKDDSSIAQPTNTPSQQPIKSFIDVSTKKDDTSIAPPKDTPSQQAKLMNRQTTILKQLKCEMCGSTNFVYQDGVYTCQYCKARYTLVQVQDQVAEDVNGFSKIDEKKRLENLYALANQALEQQKYEEALSYYRMILVEQTDYWKPVFYTCYLNYLCTGITFENMANELNNLGKGFIDAIKLFVETEDFREHSNIIKDLIDKIYNVCNEHEKNNNDWLKNHENEDDALEHLNRNKNSISALYALLGNYSDQYLNDNKKALFYWKKACGLTQDKELKKNIVETIHKYEPEYEAPNVLKGLSIGCLIFVGIFGGLFLLGYLFGEVGFAFGSLALVLFFLLVCCPSLAKH